MLNIYKTHFPYCVQKTETGYILLNRAYKPLGFLTTDTVSYADYPVGFKAKGLTDAVLLKLSHNAEVGNKTFLYQDACAPWLSASYATTYHDRLKVLGTIKLSAS